MLSDVKISIIQRLKGTTKFNAQFIRDFDHEWDAKYKNCEIYKVLEEKYAE